MLEVISVVSVNAQKQNKSSWWGCPVNNWHDIKEFPEQGIAVRIHDAEKV